MEPKKHGFASLCRRKWRARSEHNPRPSLVFESNIKTPAAWIEEFRQFLSEGRSSTMDLARTVHDAKRKLHHGQWSDMWRSAGAPFSKRKAEMLAVVGKNLGSLNAQNSAHLPSAWNTLYYLALIEPGKLTQLFSDGVIHPDLRLKEARALLEASRGSIPKRKRRSTVKQRLRRFREFIESARTEWTAQELELVEVELAKILARLSPNPPSNILFGQHQLKGRIP